MTDTAKERIIEAAGPIFAQKGFAATTVREICSAAKVNQAAINYYFGSKECLYKEVFAATYETLTPWETAELDSSLPFVERLHWIVRRRTEEIFAKELIRWKIQLMFREIHDPTTSCGEKLKEHIIEDYQQLYDFVSEYFALETPSHVRWKFILNMIGSIIHYRTSRWVVDNLAGDADRDEHFGATEVARNIADSFLLAAAPYSRKEQVAC